MTVDCTHVLATPGMDRHSSYVALSRHREGVEVHYGRDDFADAGKLARRLSRERGKDMASDYPHAREIRLPPMRVEPSQVREYAPPKVRSIFAGFRPPAPDQQRDIAVGSGQKASASDLNQAVRKYARSLTDIDRTQESGHLPLPHQEAARDKARKALDQIRPQAGRDAAAAFAHEPQLVAESAIGRTNAAIRAMQLEGVSRDNPELRADRFVENWQKLHRQSQHLLGSGDHGPARALTNRMGSMAKALERDPQVDSLLRNRKIELGLNTRSSGGIGHQLTEYLGLGRGRGVGIGM